MFVTYKFQKLTDIFLQQQCPYSSSKTRIFNIPLLSSLFSNQTRIPNISLTPSIHLSTCALLQESYLAPSTHMCKNGRYTCIIHVNVLYNIHKFIRNIQHISTKSIIYFQHLCTHPFAFLPYRADYSHIQIPPTLSTSYYIVLQILNNLPFHNNPLCF